MKARKILPRAALYLLGCLVISFFFAPGPPEDPSYTAVPDAISWTAPLDSLRRELRGKHKAILKAKTFNPKNTSQTKATNWRFSGVIKQGHEYIALIKIDDTLTRHTIGDSLPGGEQLDKITEDSITIQQDTTNYVQKLYALD